MTPRRVVFVVAGAAACLCCGSGYWLAGRALAEFPPLPATDILAPVAAHMTCHYIENLPQKPKTNQALLLEYVKAYKNFYKALNDTTNYDEYEVKLLPEPGE